MTDGMDEDDATIVNSYCNKQKWLKAGEAALDGLAPATFFKTMRQKFDVPEPQNADWSVVDALWRLEPPIVVTTNYDNVLRWRKTSSRLLLNDQPEELAGLYRNTDSSRPTIWHLHGHLERAGSLILAPSQYDQFYSDGQQAREQYKAAMEQFRSLLTNWTILFIGFGLDDAYVMSVIGDVLKTYNFGTDQYFALMRQNEKDVHELWKSHNIRVLEYAQHGPPLVKLLDELAQARDDCDASSVDAGEPNKPPVPPAYVSWLASQCSENIDLSGMRPKQGAGISLRNVYVPVTTSSFAMRDEQDLDGLELEPDEFVRGDKNQENHQLLQTIANEHSLYISGPPGSGKTTFCRWLALAVCQGEQPGHPVLAPDEYQESFPESLRGRLPLLIRLREFWSDLPQTVGGAELTRAELERVLESWVTRRKLEGLTWPIVKDHLDAGTCLLIFDGVDEVPLTAEDTHTLAQPRAMLLAGLADAVAHWRDAGNRVLVTSRPYGLTDAQQTQLNLPPAPLAALPKSLQELLVRR